ncbi:MAG: amidohydrolase [Clostridia bacterium]|nr:amidohydrolase [Clostridia bacterium]
MEGIIYENGYIIIENGKIKQVGDMADFAGGEFDEVYDAEGCYVMPGIVDGHSHIGMEEDSIGFAGDDINEDTDPILPHLRAIDAINPNDKCFREGIEAGVTTSVTGPGSANPIGGQFAAIKMQGKCVDDMIIKAPVAIKAAFGENTKQTYKEKGNMPVTRMGAAALIREALFKAKRYMEKSDGFDMKSESLIPVLKKEIPLKVHAHRLDDMATALRIAKEFDINITFDHATEGHLNTEFIKNAGCPVFIGPIITDRNKPELVNKDDAAAGILEKSGIRTALITDHPEIPCQYIALQAAVAVKNGMSVQSALEAITIVPADACGIGERVGSLKAGKDADIAVFTSVPTDTMSKTVYVFIDGKCVLSRSKNV